LLRQLRRGFGQNDAINTKLTGCTQNHESAEPDLDAFEERSAICEIDDPLT
jgi:hypothetical protein